MMHVPINIIKPVVCLKINETSLLQQKPVLLSPVEPEAVADPPPEPAINCSLWEMTVVHRNSALWRCSSRILYAFFIGLRVTVLEDVLS